MYKIKLNIDYDEEMILKTDINLCFILIYIDWITSEEWIVTLCSQFFENSSKSSLK